MMTVAESKSQKRRLVAQGVKLCELCWTPAQAEDHFLELEPPGRNEPVYVCTLCALVIAASMPRPEAII